MFCFSTRSEQSQFLDFLHFQSCVPLTLLAISTLLISQSDNITIVSAAKHFFCFRNANLKELINVESVAKSAKVTVRFQTRRSTQLSNKISLLASIQ